MYPSNLPSRSLGPSSCPFIDIHIKHIKKHGNCSKLYQFTRGYPFWSVLEWLAAAVKSGRTYVLEIRMPSRSLIFILLGKFVLVMAGGELHPPWSNVVNPISQTYQLGMIYDDTVFTTWDCDFGDDSWYLWHWVYHSITGGKNPQSPRVPRYLSLLCS